MKRNVVCIPVIFLLFASFASAQKDAATLVGQVLDSSGAAIANATVSAVDKATNYTYRAQTDSSGEWTISPVRIGQYDVTVAAGGFKSAVSSGITLDVQQRQRLDVRLQPGAVNEVVNVQDTVPLLETDNSERGQVINNRTIVTLPLNGRNAVQLAQLTAGVTLSEPGARDESGFGFSANGARSLDNNFQLDGIDNNSNLPDLLNQANYVVMPSVDALQEFKVQTNSYGAEFGRATGAIVNATVRSGTNQFHGVLYEFLRNEKLDARNFFDANIPPYKQNQFGGTLGGRIIRDKLFFFGDYEGLRVRQGQTDTSLVPTLQQRSGDLSSQLDLTTPTGVDCNGMAAYAGEVFNTRLTQASPSSPTGFCGVPFGYNADGTPSNVIPRNGQDPLGAKLTNLYPLPNANGAGYNYLSNPELVQNRNQGDVRVDQIFSQADTAFYRFSLSKQPATIPSPFPGLADGGGFFSGVAQNNGYSLAISETHIFSPTLVNELRLGYNRLHSKRNQFNSNTDVSAAVGFPGVPYQAGTNNGGLPQLSISNLSTLGSPTFLPSDEIQNTYSYADTLTVVNGNRTWKFGGEFRPEEFTIFQPADPRGYLSFAPVLTDNPAAPGTGGSGLASLLTGQPAGGSINNLNNIDYLRKTFSLFAQTDWRVSSRLTLNLGVRYEYFSPVLERFNAQANFNPSTGVLDIPKSSNVQLTPTLASLLAVNHNASNALVNSDWNNVAPRIGFAYQASHRLTLRSAFGVFYNGEESGPYSNPSPGFNPPYFASQNFVAPCSLPSANPATTDCSVPGLRRLAQGFPATSLSDPNTPNLFSIDPNIRTPYVLQWHATVQYEVSRDTLFEVAYVGSKGTKLYTFLNLNQAAPTADPSVPTAIRRPFPTIDSAIGYLNAAGNSEYDALQTKWQRRFASGLSILVNYTYSHALGNASNANLGAQNNDNFRWSRYPNWEHSNLDFDVRHHFVATADYQLPFGKGRLFGSNWRGITNAILGDWNLAGIFIVSSGTWFTVTDANGNFANSDGQQRPDSVGGESTNGKHCLPGTLFNTCAFTDPALGSFGNVGQNTVNGPGFVNLDLSTLKEFVISEKRRFEFRAEFFNLPNHTNFLFAAPGPQNSNNATVLGTPSFGYATAARPPRQIQFGLKFYY